jgi:hypothetical protein
VSSELSLPQAAAQEAVLKALLDAIDAEYKAKRAEVQALIDEVREQTGVKPQVAAALPDGTVVAKVSVPDAKPAAVVTDEKAFTAWVRDNFPTEIERRFVTEVRGSFARRLLDEMTAAGTPRWVDQDTGELHEVPGVEVRPTRSTSHSVRFEKAGREDIAAAWRAGLLGQAAPAALLPGS